tara:strand:- start:3039 stop:3245 length:207 start_codon:yes stop_codon:yes gene_type:complete
MILDFFVGLLLILIAIIMIYYIAIVKLGRNKEVFDSNPYSGVAREPEKLSEANEEAIKELEKLIRKIN